MDDRRLSRHAAMRRDGQRSPKRLHPTTVRSFSQMMQRHCDAKQCTAELVECSALNELNTTGYCHELLPPNAEDRKVA